MPFFRLSFVKFQWVMVTTVCRRVLVIIIQYIAPGKISVLAISRTGAEAMHLVVCLLTQDLALLV